MNNSSKQGKRYIPTPEETQILKTYSEKYRLAPKRSQAREAIRRECATVLHHLNPRWIPKVVRTWFTNNGESFSTKGTEFDNQGQLTPVSSINAFSQDTTNFSQNPPQYIPPSQLNQQFPLNSQLINTPISPVSLKPPQESFEQPIFDQNEHFKPIKEPEEDHQSTEALNSQESSEKIDQDEKIDHPFLLKQFQRNRSDSTEIKNKVTFQRSVDESHTLSSYSSREPSRPNSVSIPIGNRSDTLSSDSEIRQNSEELSLPEITRIDGEISTDGFDTIKYDAYNKIQEINRVLRLSESKFPENTFQRNRLKFQQEAESTFVSLTNTLSNTLGLDRILSHDPTATIVEWKASNNIRRIASATTCSYNQIESDNSSKTGADISRANSPSLINENYIFVPRKIAMPPTASEDVVNFYNGRLKQPRQVENFDHVEVSTLIQFNHCKNYVTDAVDNTFFESTTTESTGNESAANEVVQNETDDSDNVNEDDNNFEDGDNLNSISSDASIVSAMSTDDDESNEYEFLYGPAIVKFCHQSNSHVLVFKNIEVFTGFFLPATSIYFHRKHGAPGNESVLYVSGDHRVKEFTFVNTKTDNQTVEMTLKNTETFYVSDQIIDPKSTITVFNGQLALANGSMIYFWEINREEGTGKKKKTPNKKSRRRNTQFNFCGSYNKELAQRNGLNMSHIDWTKGYEPDNKLRVSQMKQITNMCIITDDSSERTYKYLAVSSDEYPVIYLYNSQRQNIARLISHTMGITSLFSYHNLLFSGSKDCQAKLWNIYKGTTCICFEYHYSSITAMACGNYLGKDVLFTAGSNNLVICWSISDNKSLFSIHLGRNLLPTKLLFLPDSANKTATLIVSSIVVDNDDDKDELAALNDIHNGCQIQTFVF